MTAPLARKFFVGLVLTSLWMLLVPSAVEANSVYFPQVALGDGYSTIFTLINLDSVLLNGQLRVFNQDGSPLATPTEWQNISISPMGSTRLTLSSGSKLALGSAYFQSNADVAGMASFERRNIDGTLESLVDVSATVASSRFVLPVEISSAGSTGIAIMNAASDPTNVRLQLVREDGSIISLKRDSRLNPFGPHAQVATFLTDFFPDIPLTDFKGTLIIEATGPAVQIAATGIAFKEGLLAGLLAIASSQPSMNEIIMGVAGSPFFVVTFQKKTITVPNNYDFALGPGVYEVSGDISGTLIIALAGPASATVGTPAVVGGSINNVRGPRVQISPCFILYSSSSGSESFSFQFTVSANTTHVCRNGVADNPLVDSNSEGGYLGRNFEEGALGRGFDLRAAAGGAGTVVVAGSSRTIDGQNFVLRAYDMVSGELRWTDQTPAFSGVSTRVFATTNGERAFAASYSPSIPCCSDIFVRAYDVNSGKVLWTDVWDKGRDDLPQGIVANSDAVVVVGYGGNTETPPISALDFLVRAYDPASGKVLWEDRVDNGLLIDDVAWAVTIDGTQVFVAGTTSVSGGRKDLFVRSYDLTTGALLWQASHADTSSPILFFVEDGQLWVSSIDQVNVFDVTSGKLLMHLPK